MIRIDLRRKLDKNLGINIDLLGFRRDRDFASMPKISVTIGMLGMRIRDKGRAVPAAGAKLRFEGKALVVSVPLSVLADPQRILSRARTRTAGFPLYASAWRILRIDEKTWKK